MTVACCLHSFVTKSYEYVILNAIRKSWVGVHNFSQFRWLHVMTSWRESDFVSVNPGYGNMTENVADKESAKDIKELLECT